MPFTLRKKITLFKFGPIKYSLNVSKRGVSLTQKVGRVTVNHRRDRTRRVSVDLPGPVSYVSGGKSTRTATRQTRRQPTRRPVDPPPWGTPEDLVEYGPEPQDRPGRFNPYG